MTIGTGRKGINQDLKSQSGPNLPSSNCGKNMVVLCVGFGMVKFIGKTNIHCFGI